jgi:hypothetical protein
LENPQSLRFLETNQTLKTLDFSYVNFKQEQMKMLSDSLKLNQSITELNFTFSNFNCWEFLKSSNNLKKLVYYLNRFSMFEKDIECLKDFVQIVSKHQSLEILKLDAPNILDDSLKAYLFLETPKLKELTLIRCLKTEEFEEFIKRLNENTTLTKLHLNYHEFQNVFTDMEITNQTIQVLNLSSTKEIF